MDSNAKTNLSLGFLTVRKHTVHGYFGGLLLLNGLARPLEFHCTLPVQTTRAQQILYGPTLDEFVCGEQVARALVLKAKTKPSVLFTDTTAALSLRHVCDVPLAAFTKLESQSTSSLVLPQTTSRELKQFRAWGHPLACMMDYQLDQQKIESIFHGENPPIDLIEPFGRIEEALMEAHPATKAAA